MPINLNKPLRPNPYYPPPTGSFPKALTVYKPPLTPIYPLPIPPPRTPSPSSFRVPPALRGFAPKALAAAKAAGSFKAPPAVGAVARKLVPFAGRAIPGIGWAFAAIDALLIACAAGWLPGNICPRPDNPSPGGNSPGFTGGQCCNVDYKVVVKIRYTDGRPIQELTLANVFRGTILGLVLITLPQANGTVRINTVLRWRNCAGIVSEEAQVSDNSPRTVFMEIIRVYPAYGAPDICGDPQPVPQPQQMPDVINNVNIVNNNINLNVTIPSFLPPSPLPNRAPIVLAPPSPLPDIIFNIDNNFPAALGDMGDQGFNYSPAFFFNPGGGANNNDPPDFFNNFPPSPEPRLRAPNPFPVSNPAVGLAPVLVNFPEVPPPLPNVLPPDSTEQDKYIYRQNKEALDKIYKANAEILEVQKEQQRQGKILENIQNLLDVEVQGSQLITRCDDESIFYSYKAKVLTAINQQLNHIKAIEQTIINEICEVESASVAASAEWWGVRLGGDVPQIALIFRVASTRTYHKLMLPHPINVAPLLNAPIVSYKKGNWMGQLVCTDNSKFTCNCGTKGEATRLLSIAASLIDPVFLGSPVRFYYAERKGVAVTDGDMRATSAQYFSTGQQDINPDWRVTFTRDGQ